MNVSAYPNIRPRTNENTKRKPIIDNYNQKINKYVKIKKIKPCVVILTISLELL